MRAFLLALGLLAGAVPIAWGQAAQPATATTVDPYPVLDAKYGFRGYKFDTPLSQLPQLQKFGKRYVDQMEIRRIDKVDLSRLDFYFYQDRLCSVVLVTEPSVEVEHLLQSLIAEYGQPQVLADQRYIWAGQRVTMVYTQVVVTANSRYVGIPVKAARVTIDTNEAYARRVAEQAGKGYKLNGTGL